MAETRRHQTLNVEGAESGQVVRSVTLVEDLPNCPSSESAMVCQDAFRSFTSGGSRSAPLVVVTNLDGYVLNSRAPDGRNCSAMPPEWRSLLVGKSSGRVDLGEIPPSVSAIHFNSIAQSFLVRALTSIAKSERVRIDKKRLAETASESRGDIRCVFLFVQSTLPLR
jgi:hypothetical protein